MKTAWTIILTMFVFLLVGCSETPTGPSMQKGTFSSIQPAIDIQPTATAVPTKEQQPTQTATPTAVPTITIATYSSGAFHPDSTKVLPCPALNVSSVVRCYVRYSNWGLPWSDNVELPAVINVSGKDHYVCYAVDVINKNVIFCFDPVDKNLSSFYYVEAEVQNVE